jgi:beta-mannosidase
VLRASELRAGWQFSAQRWLEAGKLAFSTLEWLPASVPGHVHADLLRSGVIQDPFDALGELGCQWIDKED